MRRWSVCIIGMMCLITVFPFRILAQNDPVRVLRILVPPSTSSLPFFLLADRDPLPNVDIQTHIFLNHPQALILLLRGDADLLLTGTSQGWENYLAGGPLVMINTGIWGVSCLIGSKECLDARGFADLAGLRIALPFPGSPLDFQTRYLLVKKGLDPEKDVTISYSPFTQTVSFLQMGRIDVAPLPEPLATRVVRKQGLWRIIDYRDAWAEVSGGDPRSPQVSLFTTKESLTLDGKMLIAIGDCWRGFSLEIAKEPARAAEVYARVLEMEPDIVETAIRNTLLYVPSFAENRERVLNYYERVKDYLVGDRRELKEDFFFIP